MSSAGLSARALRHASKPAQPARGRYYRSQRCLHMQQYRSSDCWVCLCPTFFERLRKVDVAAKALLQHRQHVLAELQHARHHLVLLWNHKEGRAGRVRVVRTQWRACEHGAVQSAQGRRWHRRLSSLAAQGKPAK